MLEHLDIFAVDLGEQPSGSEGVSPFVVPLRAVLAYPVLRVTSVLVPCLATW